MSDFLSDIQNERNATIRYTLHCNKRSPLDRMIAGVGVNGARKDARLWAALEVHAGGKQPLVVLPVLQSAIAMAHSIRPHLVHSLQHHRKSDSGARPATPQSARSLLECLLSKATLYSGHIAYAQATAFRCRACGTAFIKIIRIYLHISVTPTRIGKLTSYSAFV